MEDWRGQQTKLRYLTTTNKDYIPKTAERNPPCIQIQEFKDPVAEGFKQYLTVDEKEPHEPIENGDVYLEKFKNKYKKLGTMYFEKPLDHLIIKGSNLLEGKTCYQVDYCNIEAEIRRKLLEQQKEKPKLPDGWVVPYTTTNVMFRDPRVMTKGKLERGLPIWPENHLTNNEKINEILQVKTGETEYERTHGDLGEHIVKHHIYGKPEY